MQTHRAQDMASMPERMRSLPLANRNGTLWVVPWFVDWVNGEPEFRAMDREKWFRAVKEKLCWVCGQKLGSWLVFVLGPMCGITRVSSEPPSHLDCARWSAKNCPFLSRPHMRRREGNYEIEPAPAPGNAIMRNPGVALLWITRSYEPFKARGGYLIEVGPAQAYEWYCEGRPATREEVHESVVTGLPFLEAEAAGQQGGTEELNRRLKEFTAEFYPKELAQHA